MKPKDLLDDLEAGDRSMEHLVEKEPETLPQGSSMEDYTAAMRYVQGPTTWGTANWGTTTGSQMQQSQLAQQNSMNQQLYGGLGQASGTLSGAFQQAYGNGFVARLTGTTSI